ELPSSMPALQRGTLSGHDLPPDQTSDANLHMRIGLVVSLHAVLDDVGRLLQIAEVEGREYGVTFDACKCVAHRHVAFVLGLSDFQFCPVAVPLMRIAGWSSDASGDEFI